MKRNCSISDLLALKHAENIFRHCVMIETIDTSNLFTENLLKTNAKAFILMGNILESNMRVGWQKQNTYLTREERDKAEQKKQNEIYKWYKKAADADFPAGWYNLFRMHRYYGRKLKLLGSGWKYLVKAAKKGFPNAQYELGYNLIQNGNLKKGWYWLNMANRHPKREWLLCYDGPGSWELCRKWCRQSRNILEISKKAKDGDLKAMVSYANYLASSFENYNIKLAHEWHTKAAKSGYVPAYTDEAVFILKAWTDGTLEEAFNYLKCAAEAGYKKAHWFLGDCYFFGWGTSPDLEKASRHLKLAAKYGYKFAKETLKGVTEENFKEINGAQALKDFRDFYN